MTGMLVAVLTLFTVHRVWWLVVQVYGRRHHGQCACVYLLRDSRGVPLYWGSTGNWQARLHAHLGESDEVAWKADIDPASCSVARWCLTRAGAYRVERRRIRCHVIAARLQLCPEPENEATTTVDGVRVLLLRPWVWAYSLESRIDRGACWHRPVTPAELRAARATTGDVFGPLEGPAWPDTDPAPAGPCPGSGPTGPGPVGPVFPLVAPSFPGRTVVDAASEPLRSYMAGDGSDQGECAAQTPRVGFDARSFASNPTRAVKPPAQGQGQDRRVAAQRAAGRRARGPGGKFVRKEQPDTGPGTGGL